MSDNFRGKSNLGKCLLTGKKRYGKNNFFRVFSLIFVFAFLIFSAANVSAEKAWNFNNHTVNISDDLHVGGIIYGDGSGITNLDVNSLDLTEYYKKVDTYNQTEVISLIASGDVNSANFWDGLNTPADILASQIQNNMNWINFTRLSDFTNDLGIGNWTLDRVNYYTKSEVYNNTEVYDKGEVDSLFSGGNFNASSSDTLDGYDASFFMPLNKSVYGDFDFNDGWTSGGVSIVGGNVYAQSGYFYDINSLSVSTLTVNGSIIPPSGFGSTFDLGSSSLQWRDAFFSRNVAAQQYCDENGANCKTITSIDAADGYIGEVGGHTAGSALDMANYLITNIGNAGTDFTATGGLTLAGAFDPNGAITLPTTGISGAGTGSGLDADLWDGNEFATYINQAVLTTSGVTFDTVNTGLGNMEIGDASITDNELLSVPTTNAVYDFVLAQVLAGGADGYIGNAQTHTSGGDLNMGNNSITNIDWATSDDGTGSGLDADLLDGLDSTNFYNASNPAGYITLGQVPSVVDVWVNSSGDSMSGTLDMANNLITNIGNAGTDFTATGGLTLAGAFDPNGAITLPTTGITGAGTGSGLDADTLDGVANTDDYIMVGSGSAWQGKVIPDCPTGKLLYTASTNTFSCGTDDTGVKLTENEVEAYIFDADAQTILGDWVNTANPWAVNEGGTGTDTLTDHGVVLGSGTGAVTVTEAGTSGFALVAAGASADPTWVDVITEADMDTLAEWDAQIGLTGTPGTSNFLRGDGSWINLSTAETDPVWISEKGSYWATSADLDTVISTDEISEIKIDFNTVCPAGSHLYISGNNLACETDDDTWNANTQGAAGYVAAGGTNYNYVWKTDGSGVPAWRVDDAGSDTQDLGISGNTITLVDGGSVTAPYATVAGALAANGANCAAGSYPLGVNAAGVVEGCTVDDTGTWNANALGVDGYVAGPTGATINLVWKTDASGNPAWRADAVNDGVYNLATMQTAVTNDFHNLGGVDAVNDGVYNLATMQSAVNDDFHNLGGVDAVNDGVYNLATMQTAVTNDFHNLGGVDANTWNANALTVAGYVAAPTTGTVNLVWKTDASGNPAWRADDTGSQLSEATVEAYIFDADAETVSGIWTYSAIPAFNGGASGSTSPFTVDSTTVVTNLNADLFDGRNSDDFVDDDGDTMYGSLTFSGAFGIENAAKVDFSAAGLGAHPTEDGVIYKYGGQGYLAVDDNLYIRDTSGSNAFHFQTDTGAFLAGTIDTGYGDFEIGQNLRTTDSPTFAAASITGAVTTDGLNANSGTDLVLNSSTGSGSVIIVIG